MERKMESILVNTTEEGLIQVVQEHISGLGGSEDIIIIYPEQVDTVCRWLKEARDSLRQQT